MTALCVVCGAVLRGAIQAYGCGDCAATLGLALERLADHATAAADAVARLTAFGTGGAGDRPLPVNLAAAERISAVVAVVSTWTRAVAATRGLPVTGPARPIGPPCGLGGCRHNTCRGIRTAMEVAPTRLAVAAGWLAGQTGWLRGRPDYATAHMELLTAARDLETMIDRPPARWYAGPCNAIVGRGGGEQECGADLHARSGADTITCRACGATFSARARREWLLDAAQDALLHAEWMARALTALGVGNPDGRPLTSAQLRNFADRGRLASHGRDHAGRPLYRVGDVIELAANLVAVAQAKAAKRAATTPAADSAA